MFTNECFDSAMGRIHVCFAVLLASGDPRTSWSFQFVLQIPLEVPSHPKVYLRSHPFGDSDLIFFAADPDVRILKIHHSFQQGKL
jgi:hypothetical protein